MKELEKAGGGADAAKDADLRGAATDWTADAAPPKRAASWSTFMAKAELAVMGER